MPTALSPSGFVDAFGRAALVAGHPGHELKVFGWMSQLRPRLYFLTDGSGQQAASRLVSSETLAHSLGAGLDRSFHATPDIEIYKAMLEKKPAVFIGILDRLAESLIDHDIDFVAADATEGFNPTHDICRALVNGAVLMAGNATGKTIRNYEFQLTGWERNAEEIHDEECLHLALDDDLLQRKFAAAEAYSEIKEEVRRSIEYHGQEYFRTECLRRVTPIPLCDSPSEKPFYESWGEQQVAAGRYKSVIRFREHVLPIMQAVSHHAETCAPVVKVP